MYEGLGAGTCGFPLVSRLCLLRGGGWRCGSRLGFAVVSLVGISFVWLVWVVGLTWSGRFRIGVGRRYLIYVGFRQFESSIRTFLLIRLFCSLHTISPLLDGRR